MNINTNSLPQYYSANDAINDIKRHRAMGIMVNDPTKDINVSNLWGESLSEFAKQIDLLKLDNKLLRLKILALEGKFTQDEVTNITKMLMSEDEASKTLANTIIENA